MAMKLSAKDHIHTFELEHASKLKMKKVKIKARPETSHIVSSGSDQLLHRDMSSLFDEGSNKELFDKDIDYAKIPGINKITAAQMKSLKEKTKKNAKKIESILNLAKAVGSLGSGIGSGGYISRQLKAPGPHNGHNYVAPHERLIQSDLKLPDNIDDYLPKPKELVHDHPWDKNFVVARSISRDAYDEIKKITTFSALQIEVKEMCGKSGLATPNPKTIDSSTNADHESSDVEYMSTKSKEETENGDDYEDEFEDEINAVDDSKQQQHGSNIELTAEQQWMKNLQRVHFIGSIVLHIDLWEVSQYFEPPEIVVDVVGYLCILLGLKPTWDSAQGYLFKEINQVMKFLMCSEPLKIPKRRLRKAKQLKEEKVTTRQLMMLVDNKAMKKLVNWIFQFQKLADAILKVDERLKGRKVRAASPPPAALACDRVDKKKKGAISPLKDKAALKDLGEFFAELQMLLDSPEPQSAVAAEVIVPAAENKPCFKGQGTSHFEAEYFSDEPPELFEFAEIASVAAQSTALAEEALIATTAPPPSVPEPQSAPKKVTFELTDKIEANYNGKGNWYRGTVTKVHANGRYDIKYDDGDSEIAVEKSNVRECSVAEIVPGVAEALRAKESRSEAASSSQKKTAADNEYVADKFDSTDASSTPALKPTAKHTTFHLSAATSSERVVRFKVGDKVEGNYKGKGKWLPGRISKVNNNGSCDVLYEDKHVDYMAKRPHVRVSPSESAAADKIAPRSRPAVDSEPSLKSTDESISATVSNSRRSASPSKGFRIGETVEALGFKSKGKWLKGAVAKVNSNGSYNVIFDDGSVERMVKRANLRPCDVSAGEIMAAEPDKETDVAIHNEPIHMKKEETEAMTTLPIFGNEAPEKSCVKSNDRAAKIDDPNEFKDDIKIDLVLKSEPEKHVTEDVGYDMEFDDDDDDDD